MQFFRYLLYPSQLYMFRMPRPSILRSTVMYRREGTVYVCMWCVVRGRVPTFTLHNNNITLFKQLCDSIRCNFTPLPFYIRISFFVTVMKSNRKFSIVFCHSFIYTLFCFYQFSVIFVKFTKLKSIFSGKFLSNILQFFSHSRNII